MPSYPQGVNPTEVLQDTIKKVYNERVRDWFKEYRDITTFDLSIPRQAAFAACWHLDSDSTHETELKISLFNEIRSQHSPNLVGETNQNEKVIRRGKPQIVLFFQEDFQDVEPDYAPVTGKITFRIMEKTQSLTEAKLREIANKVKSIFRPQSAQIWKKGKIYCTYSDWAEGYQLQLLVRDATEGKSLVNRVLQIKGDTPNWTYFNTIENSSPTEAFPTLPSREMILSENRRLPRRRPIASVRFQYALVQINALPLPIVLIDRSGHFSNPLIDW